MGFYFSETVWREVVIFLSPPPHPPYPLHTVIRAPLTYADDWLIDWFVFYDVAAKTTG